MFQKVRYKERLKTSAIHANSIFRQELLKEKPREEKLTEAS